ADHGGRVRLVTFPVEVTYGRRGYFRCKKNAGFSDILPMTLGSPTFCKEDCGPSWHSLRESQCPGEDEHKHRSDYAPSAKTRDSRSRRFTPAAKPSPVNWAGENS